MAEGRSRSLWGHTSSVLCLLANVNRDPKKTRAYRPADFDPHATPGRRLRGRRVSVERLTKDIMRMAEQARG